MMKKTTTKQRDSFGGIVLSKMRNLFCLLLATILFVGQVFAENSSVLKSISVKLPSTELSFSDLVSAIESQTNYLVIYKNSEISKNENITLKESEDEVYSILEQVSTAKDVDFALENNYIIISKKVQTASATSTSVGQQKGYITGNVKDEKGNSVIGATVIVKGTTTGGITDADGNFTINKSAPLTLEVSCMGYITKEVEVQNDAFLTVVLSEDALAVDEVVVVGYGTMKRSDLTGSVVSANLEKIQSSSNVSLVESLQGSIAGLNVGMAASAGTSPSMSIRGKTTISGATSPLIVLDGIIFRGSMIDINPNDIESVDVLKDASSTAIYGAQATNGVILITSKTGDVNQKPIIEYNGTVSISRIANSDMLPNDAEAYIKRVGDCYLQDSRIGEDMLEMNPDFDPASKLTYEQAISGIDNGVDVNWFDLLSNPTPTSQSHNLSVRGKTQRSGYYMSAGLTDQKNLLINDTYNRYNVRVNLDTKITDWLKVGVQSFFTSSDYSGVSPDISSLYNISPVCAAYDDNGDIIERPWGTTISPLFVTDEDDLNVRNTLFANFYTDVTIPWVKGLSYRMNYSQNLEFNKHYNYDATGANFQGSAYKTNNNEYQWTLDNILTYKHSFGDHDVNATFVYGAEEREYESTKASGSIFTNGKLGYNNIGACQSDQQNISSSAWRETSLYMMMRAAYTYNDRYMFTGTVRRDGFSGFGANNKFGIFPSAAVAWRLSEEDFMQDVEWIDNLKLRLSYGVNGNRTVGRYSTLSKVSDGSGYLFGDGAPAENYQRVTSLANADLKWETTNTLNVGVDLEVLKGVLSVSAEYYISNTNDLLYSVSIPNINGFSSTNANIGKMGNKGQEVTITARPFSKPDFSWTLVGSFSRNRNKVKSILGIDADGDGKEDDLVANSIFIGEPYGALYSYNQIGMWQLDDYYAGTIPDGFTYGTYKVEDINGDGVITAAEDRVIRGYSTPSYRFSIQSNMRYKDFEFSFMINSIQGGKRYYLGTPASSIFTPMNEASYGGFDFDYWTPENSDARYRQLGAYNATLGSGYSPAISRSFIRLQDVSFAYNLPKHIIDKLGMRSCRFFVSGKNLCILTDWDGWDPEANQGLSKTSNPLLRTFTTGLNIQF